MENFTAELYGVWFLIGTALVFFMQAGFAMVETGFTRAKNAGNIIMKNLMDFCLGTVMFIFIGFAIMMSEDYIFGLIGLPNFDIFADFANFPSSAFVFNLVFCATAATIVSGAMAERTKFSAYLIYSGVISAIVYPIEAGWVWNSQGWLFNLGFIDFAGSAVIHTVGGVSAIIGIIFLGPRLGKYVEDKKTKKIVAKAIPGHNLTIGALGVFILWFGWYGFNGAAAVSLNGLDGLAAIFVKTTIAPAIASVVTMMFTWIKNGKPDVSMTLNGSLAGLVGITAGCATLDALGSIIVGIVSGILVVVAVEFIDIRLKLDDPVGAVAVHGVNGIWGTIAVGLLAVDGGLFYGGGFRLLGIQILGISAIILWTIVTMVITFSIIKKVHGLRVSEEEETLGLDSTEHGLASSYADFMPLTENSMASPIIKTPSEKAIPVVNNSKPGAVLTKVVVVTKQSKFEQLKHDLEMLGVTGITVTQVLGCGMQKGSRDKYRGVEVEATLLPKVKVEIVVCKIPCDVVIQTIKKALYTGNIGDGKIFVYGVDNVIKVRTGEEGYDALQDE